MIIPDMRIYDMHANLLSCHARQIYRVPGFAECGSRCFKEECRVVSNLMPGGPNL